MARLKVAVLFGGRSNEHDISRISAVHVIESIPKDKYDVVTVGITKKGHWFRFNGDTGLIASGEWEKHPDNVPCILSPDPIHKGFIVFERDGEAVSLKVDCVFPVLHGRNGEDGTVQGLLELAGMPYVGCDLISSAMCMDKDTTHTILEANGISTAKWVRILRSELDDKLSEKCDIMERELTYPMFVKPCNCGSSVGISKVTDRDELEAGIKQAFVYDKKVIVEEGIAGREMECAVMGNLEPFASDIGEILPANDFYDYDAKYNDAGSMTVIPAKISDADREAIRTVAVKAYKALGCGGLSRVDFFLKEDGTVILNEINTMPGHTGISMYPMLMENIGISCEEQEDRLIKLALDRAGVDYE
ncbi:MAG: D-alanine--D-alanine ligase [Ruminococcus sp.]|nr:D-alanine--D-alanine ligase [Ruminococcus sp.]